MKAIKKDGAEYEVRFYNDHNFMHEFSKGLDRISDNNVLGDILVKGKWYTVWFKWHCDSNDKLVFYVEVGEDALRAMGIEGLKLGNILLDGDWRPAFKSFAQSIYDNFAAQANKVAFHEVTILEYGGTFDACFWDAKEDRCLANYNDKVRYITKLAELAWWEKLSPYCYSREEDPLRKYLKKNADGMYYVFNVEKDIPDLEKLAAPAIEKERLRKEMKKNIAGGAVYFHCETAPHNEDLSQVILARPCPQEGTFTLMHTIEKKDFYRIRPYGTYWDADWLDQCDMFYSDPGWRFGVDAIKELLKDHRVFVDYQEIKQ